MYSVFMLLPERHSWKLVLFPKHYVKIMGDDGEYHDCCPKCRASDLQLCSMCEAEKPLGQFRRLSRGTHAKTCITCERPPCYNCGKAYPAGAEPLKKMIAIKRITFVPQVANQIPVLLICSFVQCVRSRNLLDSSASYHVERM